jgi:hypothetical protein
MSKLKFFNQVKNIKSELKNIKEIIIDFSSISKGFLTGLPKHNISDINIDKENIMKDKGSNQNVKFLI